MNPADIDVEELLPHAGNMVLVQQLIYADEENATATVVVKNDGLFSGPNNQVPAWVGIEYMAQTIAAWAGFHALKNNEKVKLGFLLGTRKYQSNVGHFDVGQTLKVEIQMMMQGDNGLGAFSCKISSDDILVEANLNVFQSDDAILETQSDTAATNNQVNPL
ncbi:MAG: hotdog family protein [Pseudomonadales bacterium]|nr:hotdog family protein [Pseudomonadales bacterium]